MKKRTSAPKQPLYIVLISVHGLIRGHDLELGAMRILAAKPSTSWNLLVP